jgi:tetratricopeptide (TPR) repeat protein
LTADAARTLARATLALDAHEYERAIDVLVEGSDLFRGEPEAELERLLSEAWGRMSMGDVEHALLILTRARSLSEQPVISDLARARVLFQLGCCRLKVGMVPNAVHLLTTALDICDRAPKTDDRLRVEILDWRVRCYRRQREWDAARADADAGIELAERFGNPELLANAYFQASMVAERTSDLLIARFYVERAVTLFQEADRQLDAGRALNNLGGILFLLGDPDEAKAKLKEAFTIALEQGQDVDAGYAVSSTAQVLLRGGEPEEAERTVRYALQLLDGRCDHPNEVGNAQLVLGRALLEQGRFDEARQTLADADASFQKMDSMGHRAAAWLAQGDLAARQNDLVTAATIYRLAADALQDVRF